MKLSIRQAVTRSISIGKTAAAAGISWEAAQLTGTHRPYFAPLAAILCLQVTVEESLWQGYQRVLGIVGGVVVADLVSRYTGIHGWSIALLVLVGTSAAAFLKLGTRATSQVGVSAMMVLTVGGGHYSYSLDRIGDTLIGAVIAVLINMFVFPPDYTPQAKVAVQKAAAQLAERFHAMWVWLATEAGEQSGRELQAKTREYLEALHKTEEQVRKARQALYFSPLVRKRHEGLRQCQEDFRRLRQGYAHATGMMRTLLEWSESRTMTEDQRQHWIAQLQRVSNVIALWRCKDFQHGDFTADQGEGQRVSAPQSQPDMVEGPNRFRYALLNDVRQLLEDFGRVSVTSNGRVVE